MRERPYAALYPQLTTKSNTFTVHYHVQVLKKVKGTDSAVWTEGKDKVQSEYRGSTLIERYIDPNSADLPDFAIDKTKSLDEYYHFRTLSSRRFAP